MSINISHAGVPTAGEIDLSPFGYQIAGHYWKRISQGMASLKSSNVMVVFLMAL